MSKNLIYVIFQPAPSSVVRAEVFRGLLTSDGYTVSYHYCYSKKLYEVQSFFEKREWFPLSLFIKGIQRVIRYINVYVLASKIGKYDAVILIKYINPSMLKVLKNKIRGKILYDFDDAVWLPQWLGEENFREIVKSVDFVSCDNHYLLSAATTHNSNSFVLNGPCQIELFENYKVTSDAETKDVVIGWIGSPHTLFYLSVVFDALEEIGSKYPQVILHLIGTGFDSSKIPDFKEIRVVPIPTYNQGEMVKYVKNFDIGLYPLFNDEISLGRGSLKATIYMAGGIPALCSAFGENCNLIKEGENGLLAGDSREWFDKLEILILDSGLRKKIGEQGFVFAKENLSLEACYKQLTFNFLNRI